MRGGRQSRCGPSSGPTAPRATSTERLIGTSTHRAGMLFYTIFMASCIMCRIFSRWGVDGRLARLAFYLWGVETRCMLLMQMGQRQEPCLWHAE